MAAIIDPGKRRHELELQQPSLASDDMGGWSETWATVASMFAAIRPVRARSQFGADQRIETTTHRITVPARDDLRSGMRFILQERIFEIITVHDPDEAGQYLVCETREIGR